MEQLLQEELNPEGFRLIREKAEYNALVLHKEDVENPIFRVDMLLDKVSPKQIFEVLKDQAAVQTWFGKNLQSRVIPTNLQGLQGLEPNEKVYSTVHKGGVFPLKNREIIHRHLLQADDEKQTYIVSFTTLGLENIPSKQKSKYARAFHGLCGLVIRGGLFSADKPLEAVGSKVFFISQMEFAGQYVPVADQVKAVPQFMLEFVERLIDRAQKVKI